jgi:hypothetical protein
MSLGLRIAIAILVVALDAAVFVVPLAGLFVAYVIVARPPWFPEWVKLLYADGDGAASGDGSPLADRGPSADPKADP